MDTQDIEIEQKLKARLSDIFPPRELFDVVLQSVTKTDAERYTIQKAGVLSPYQFTHVLNLKKALLLGIPTAVLTLVAVVMLSYPSSVPAPIANTQHNDNVVSVRDVAQGTSVLKAVSGSTDSIVESVATDMLTDLDTEVADSDDEVALNAELDNYNSLQITPYENTL